MPHDGIQEIIDTRWNNKWTDLPPDVAREVEKSFEHARRARDMLEQHESTKAEETER